MGKKVNRVSYRLDSKGIKSLPVEDIRAIIRGADEMILSGGRNLLVKVLKGSKAKKVLELELDQSPGLTEESSFVRSHTGGDYD